MDLKLKIRPPHYAHSVYIDCVTEFDPTLVQFEDGAFYPNHDDVIRLMPHKNIVTEIISWQESRLLLKGTAIGTRFSAYKGLLDFLKDFTPDFAFKGNFVMLVSPHSLGTGRHLLSQYIIQKELILLNREELEFQLSNLYEKTFKLSKYFYQQILIGFTHPYCSFLRREVGYSPQRKFKVMIDPLTSVIEIIEGEFVSGEIHGLPRIKSKVKFLPEGETYRIKRGQKRKYQPIKRVEKAIQK